MTFAPVVGARFGSVFGLGPDGELVFKPEGRLDTEYTSTTEEKKVTKNNKYARAEVDERERVCLGWGGGRGGAVTHVPQFRCCGRRR